MKKDEFDGEKNYFEALFTHRYEYKSDNSDLEV
jgi:hypothetical protein